MKDKWKIILFAIIFFTAYYVPFENVNLPGPVAESLLMLQDYARHHVLLCLVPAFFIAGAIAVFLSQDAVLKYFGSGAKKIISYGIASVSGAVLAVCSCTVLPLFAGIYKRGAGLGPAVTFLYSGPAVNVLAVILTAKVLGTELGMARAVGAVLFSIVIGLMMHFIFRKEEKERISDNGNFYTGEDDGSLPLYKNAIYLAVMIGILVFMNWGSADSKLWNVIFLVKWYISGGLFVILIFLTVIWFSKENLKEWFASTWGFSKQIIPLLFIGVIIAGFLLGRPGHESLIPSNWIYALVGGNSISANLFASVAGAFMYFATLTEIPILQGLMGNGMGKGPALALLLAGPALSLPNMLVIRSILGTKKTLVYIILVIIMAGISGMLYGTL